PARKDLVRSQPQFPAAAAARDRAPRRGVAVEPGDPDRAGATDLAGVGRTRLGPDPARAQEEAVDRLRPRLSRRCRRTVPAASPHRDRACASIPRNLSDTILTDAPPPAGNYVRPQQP